MTLQKQSNGKVGRPREWFSWTDILNVRRIYQVMNQGFFKCKCGNNDVSTLRLGWDGKRGRIRIHCGCGRQTDIEAQHGWYCSEHEDIEIHKVIPESIPE